MQFYNFPEYLRQNARWAVWRYEQQPDKDKPGKPPRSPSTGGLIDVNKPDEWGTFAEAIAAYGDGIWYNGIGFLIEKRLNVTVVDLDYKDNRPEAIATLHQRIYQKLNSYSEYSPSGLGLHIVSHGVVPTARRFDVEVYSDQRFMTVTGRVLNPAPIADNQWILEKLVEEIIGERKERKPLDMAAPQTHDDEIIIQRGYSAANGAKFAALWEGNWQQLGYPSQSEADFALINMLVYYTSNVQQIRRLFFKSALGARDKLIERPALLDSMISAGFDRVVPEIDTSALKAQLDAKLAAQEAARTVPAAVMASGVHLDAIPPPPGALGAVCQWFMQAAPYPAPEIALAGGLGFMAGLCGAGWSVHGEPLNLFLLLTAPSAVGKNITTSGSVRLMDAIIKHPAMFTGTRLDASWTNDLIGPAVIASGSALTKHLKRDFMSTVSIQEEFGVELEKLNNPHASLGMLQLRQMYLKLAASGTLGEDIWSDKEQNTSVRRGVAFTLLGESVPERIYKNLDALQVADGFLGRLLLIEMPTGRLDFQKNAYAAKPDNTLVEYLIRVGAFAADRCRQQTPMAVNLTPDAEALYEAKRHEWRTRHVGPDLPDYAPIWGRCAVKTIRVAALIAIGKNFQNPIIDADAINWAADLVERGTKAIIGRFERGEIGETDQQRVSLMQELLKRYVTGRAGHSGKYFRPEWHSNRQIAKSHLHMICTSRPQFRGDTQAFERCFKHLLESGAVALIPKEKYSSPFNGILLQITADAI